MNDKEHQLIFAMLALQECKIVELQHALEKQRPATISREERRAIRIDLAARYRGIAQDIGAPSFDLGIENPPDDMAVPPADR